MDDVYVIGRNVLSFLKQFMHLLPEGPPSAPAYEIRGASHNNSSTMVENPGILLTVKKSDMASENKLKGI
jgi:hypothetical protein